ncbi:MAG TPA: TIGR03000 domain-containing protein [Gemmataceae bacterium]|nr:TIGR03000 domain-containing protein [Gemmataceae bacterium]
MSRTFYVTIGTAAIAVAAFLMTPDFTLAQRHGGGGGRGGGGSWHGGGGVSHGGGWDGGGRRGWYGGGGWGYPGYGYYGWDYPSYYGYDSYGYAPDYYSYQPDYYSNYASPDYSYFGTASGDRFYGSVTSGRRSAEDVNSAFIDLRVPPNARVLFEGQKTTQTGNFRRYISPALTPDKDFTYDVEAQWTENGRVVKRARKVHVRAGQTVMVDFLRPMATNEGMGNTPDGTRKAPGTLPPATPRSGGSSGGTTSGATGNQSGTVTSANPPGKPPE